MSAEAHWFGDPARPLFGWIHRPASGRARACVVLCPSMGQEAGFTHYTLLQLAHALEALDFLVLRFDYDATGDSYGDGEDPERVAAWLGSVRTAVGHARAQTDAPVVLLGMRLGALLAASAAGDLDVSGLVLWDSPRSGTSFVREQRVRQSAGLGDDAPSVRPAGLVALGLTFSAQTVSEMSSLDLRALGPLPCDLALSVDRPGQHPLGRTTHTRSGREVDHLEAADQDELLYRQTTPDDTLAALARWFDTQLPRESHPVAELQDARAELELGEGTERVVSIGPHHLFGVLHEPHEPRSSTTVVFIPEFHTPHHGMSRVWTDLARTWGALGYRSLRFDLSGIGDSEPHEGLEGHRLGVFEHIDDTVQAMRVASPDDPGETLLIGLCSGAYLGLEAAMQLPPRSVALINPRFSVVPTERPTSRRRLAMQRNRPILNLLFGRAAGRLGKKLAKPTYAPILTLDPTFDWSRSFEVGFWQNYLLRIASWMPDWLWALLNRVVLKRRPIDTMRDVTAHGTHLLLLAGEGDWQKSTVGALAPLRSLEREGHIRLVRDDELDHAVMRPGVKDTLMRILTEYVTTVAPTGSAQPAVGTPVEQQRVHRRSS